MQSDRATGDGVQQSAWRAPALRWRSLPCFRISIMKSVEPKRTGEPLREWNVTNAKDRLDRRRRRPRRTRRLYETVKGISPTGEVDDVIRCLSLRPDFLAPIVQAARLHFTDGALTQAQHEMIASYVSALNHCDYCLSGHTRFLQLHGERHHQTAHALREGNLEAAGSARPSGCCWSL